MRIALDLPRRFDFRRTVLSHGWYSLAPFRTGSRGDVLETVVALPDDEAHRIRLEREGRGAALHIAGRPRAAVRDSLHGAARRILNLDLDLSPFHRVARGAHGMRWIADRAEGRLLRCPTVFEDLVKLVLTTNCSWAFTTKMVAAMVDRYGPRDRDGEAAFPGPAAIARAGERELRDGVRAGYRAPTLARLARRVANGEPDPEAWPAADPDEVRREILALPGAGPYVADTLLRILGCPVGLGLDSWLRSKYSRVYHGGRKISDRTIARRYARFDRWAGLALWCDMTRDWFDGDEPAVGIVETGQT